MGISGKIRVNFYRLISRQIERFLVVGRELLLPL